MPKLSKSRTDAQPAAATVSLKPRDWRKDPAATAKHDLLAAIREYINHPPGGEKLPRLPLEIPEYVNSALNVVTIWGRFGVTPTVCVVAGQGLPLFKARPEVAIISGAREALTLAGSPFVKMLEGTYICAAQEGRHPRWLRSVPITLTDQIAGLAYDIGFSATAVYTLVMLEVLVNLPLPGDACERMRTELDTCAKELQRRADVITSIRSLR
jgi:hypothetical protein